MTDPDRLSFSALFRDEVARGLKTSLMRAVPSLLLAIISVSAVVSYFASDDLFKPTGWGTLATVYAGLVTFSGITLALTWSAISRVYETVSKAEFSRFLRTAGILNTYLFYIALVHSVQVVSAVVAVLGLISVFEPIPTVFSRFMLGLSLTSTLYAIRWAAGSAKLVQDLAWHYSTFDELTPAERQKLFLVASRA